MKIHSTMVLGVDPGMNETGIAVRDGDVCRAAETVLREDLSDRDYIDEVLEACAELISKWDVEIIGVEGIQAEHLYRGQKDKGRKNPIGAVKTAMMLGAILGRFPGAVIVSPGGNGQGPLLAYPEELRPTRGQGRGHDWLRHCRSAWDVAGVRPAIIRAVGETSSSAVEVVR